MQAKTGARAAETTSLLESSASSSRPAAWW
jgi:hypothetical protein